MNIRRAVVLGGVSKNPQINALKRGVHVLVATPGRLLDLVNMRGCDLSGVHTLILDEADRMFDMGFIRDIRKIVSLIPMKRRTALFSATMPAEIQEVRLRSPERTVSRRPVVQADRRRSHRSEGHDRTRHRKTEPPAYAARRSGVRTRDRC